MRVGVHVELLQCVLTVDLEIFARTEALHHMIAQRNGDFASEICSRIEVLQRMVLKDTWSYRFKDARLKPFKILLKLYVSSSISTNCR